MVQWVENNNSQWVEDNLAQWGVEISSVNQIWADDNYVYTVTVDNMIIYDLASEQQYAYVTYSGGFNTVWANDNRVFVGTPDAGVKYLNKSCISGSIADPYDITICLSDFSDLTPYSNLTSDNIRYLHGYESTVLAITNLGVDVIKINPQSYRSYTSTTTAYKGFMTSTGKFYYVTYGFEWSLDRVDSTLTDWTEPDYSWITGSGILASGVELNDIFITENTSINGTDNTIFIATSSGVYVIDEETHGYLIYTTPFLKGISNDFSSIWSDSTSSSGTGKMYIGSQGNFQVINLSDQTIYDWYSETQKGRGNETLDNNDIVDINVTQGV